MKGSILRRGNTWTCYWSSVDPSNGERRQHSRGGFRKKEASKPPKGVAPGSPSNRILGGADDGTWRPRNQSALQSCLPTGWR